jgi:PQQ-like domain
VARGRHGWLRRWALVGVLAVIAFAPIEASGTPASGCAVSSCGRHGAVLWARPLPGSWTIASTVLGTVPASTVPASTGPASTGPASTEPASTEPAGTGPATQGGAVLTGSGQPYAAAGKTVAAIGYGMTVRGYAARNGQPLWTTALSGFPAGSQIVSVRVWPGVVTAGVARPDRPGAAAGTQSAVVLSASGGRRLRSFPAAPFGGTVTADTRHTVVVGPTAVTSYDNATGRVNWTRLTGGAAQGWQKAGETLYVTEAAGSHAATALRRISLRTGAEQVIRAPGGSFAGRIAAAADGVVLFAGAQGVSAYRGSTGQLLWRRPGALPESIDIVRGLFYLSTGSTLAGVLPSTGRTQTRLTGADGSGAAGVYGVRGGVALGLDQGPAAQIWGYDVASQRVIWTTRTLPWLHYFTDLSGIGGSADPRSGTVLVTDCPQPVQVGARQLCQQPELVLIGR